jgi:hypothetical protein
MAIWRSSHRFVFTNAIAALLLFMATAHAALFGRSFDDDRLTLVPNKSRVQGEWCAGIDALKGNRHSGINIEIREDNSTYGFYLPMERAPQVEGKIGDGKPIHFTIAGDSGDLKFDGAVKGKSASGEYTFEPNKEYVAEAGKLLNTEISDDELLKLAFARISLAYLRGVHDALPSASLKDIVRLRNFGLDPDGIKAFVAAGFSQVDELTRLRSHGVTPKYATKARAAGYGKTADEITRLRNFGVTPEYLAGWKDAGFGLSTEEVVHLRNFGVQPEYGAAWKKAGFNVDPEALVRARNFGVPIEFAAALAAVGAKPTMEEIVRMRQFGISPDYFRQVKEQKPNYTVEEIVRLRQYGVQPDYLKTISSGRADFSAEQIIKLRNHGVPAEYVAALNIPDRKPLDAEAIIDLRSRGVSVDTARKLRE